MIICLCHKVSDRDIAREAASGCRDFETLQDETRVGTACGACTDCARETFAECTTRDCASPQGRIAPTATLLGLALAR